VQAQIPEGSESNTERTRMKLESQGSFTSLRIAPVIDTLGDEERKTEANAGSRRASRAKRASVSWGMEDEVRSFTLVPVVD
jgi:hypothetical protein